ncbi:MAG TPA: hypothetical protein PLZ16_03475, partial [Gammaproteobacteria bacterium]|nr:hypothetical protein [Gammaproteobacteria bacterium]
MGCPVVVSGIQRDAHVHQGGRSPVGGCGIAIFSLPSGLDKSHEFPAGEDDWAWVSAIPPWPLVTVVHRESGRNWSESMSNTFFASAFRRFVLGAGLMVTIGFGAMVHSAESILDNVNLALDSKLRQSSQAFEGEPARAIDGNTDGDYLNGHSVTHTEKERNAWWEADLGRERPVSMVAFYNRTDCCEERLDDVEV